MILSKSKIIKRHAVNINEAYKIPVTGSQSVAVEPEEIITDNANNADKDNVNISDPHEKEREPNIAAEPDKPDETEKLREEREQREKQKEEKKQADILSERERELDRERAKNEAVEQARAQAQRTSDLIVSHTLENAKAELSAAISQGYADGFESGRNEAAAVIAPALEKIGLLTAAVTKMQDEMLEDFKNEMFGIIAGISQKILKREIDSNDEYLLTLFEEALKDIKAEGFVTVTVSESQVEFALRNIDLFKAKVANIEDFKIIADKGAERGTMIVETAKAVADASFAVQMNEINYILDRIKENISVAGDALQDYMFEGGADS
jgi:flagellar assembly protein FliH